MKVAVLAFFAFLCWLVPFPFVFGAEPLLLTLELCFSSGRLELCSRGLTGLANCSALLLGST